MTLLKKKQKDDRKEDLEKNKKSSKSGSSSKKKKQESPRPWTPKERKIVFIVLLATIFISGVLAATARNWKLPNLPKITIPTLDFFKGQRITLEAEKGTPEEKEKAERVISEFKLLTNKFSGVYALYVVNLDTGFAYGVSNNERMQAASLIKLPAMAALYIEDEAGRLDLDSEYTLKNSDKVGGSGSLSSQEEGTVLTYRQLIEYMGKQSDNTAFNIAVNTLGEEKIRETIKDIGMTSTDFDENETTPSDIGLFFRLLWQGEIVSTKNKDELLGFMSDTIYEQWLAAGVPKDIKVSHKYGRELHSVNDAGIIFADTPFVVVIMTDGVVEREADEVFSELSKVVYEFQTND